MRIILVTAFILFFTIPVAGQAENEIVINEIMYHSSGNDVEFIELYNASESLWNLHKWYLLDDNYDHEPCFIEWTLNPGEYLVVAADVNQFASKYPEVSPVNPHAFNSGGNGWSLGNSGDVIRLFDSSNTLHDSVAYKDGGDWPNSPDGKGPSLELLNSGSDNSIPGSWDPSLVDNGTPGVENSAYTEDIKPIFWDGERSVALPTNTDEVTVTVMAFDNEGLLQVDLFVDTGNGYISQTMYDNGLHGDVTAGDSIYTTVIEEHSTNTLVKYYAVATDNIGQQNRWPNDTPSEYHAYTVDYTPPKLLITEVLAVNDAVNTDEFGEYDDWFEIHNAGPEDANLGGMYISNSLGSSKSFELPGLSLAPDEYFIFWADNDTDQGDSHVDFKLSSDGEAIALFETVDHGNVLIHGWKYGIMSIDVSMGLMPEDGSAPEYLTSPTPGEKNNSSELFSPVCINEFQTTSNFGGPDDWVEIYNRGAEPFDLSGCFLSDQRSNNTKWAFPKETVLAPGEFLVVYEDVLGFGFSSEGDEVIMLTASDSTTALDFYDFKEQQADISEGRFPDGVNTWQKFNHPTEGSSNSQSNIVEEDLNMIPNELTLNQNYPNPFNPITTIPFSVPESAHVNLTVYSVLGQRVTSLLDDQLSAGSHTVQFDASDLSSGIYFCCIEAGGFIKTVSMIVLK